MDQRLPPKALPVRLHLILEEAFAATSSSAGDEVERWLWQDEGTPELLHLLTWHIVFRALLRRRELPPPDDAEGLERAVAKGLDLMSHVFSAIMYVAARQK